MAAEIGCVECKGILAEGINRSFAPFRERRRELAARPSHVKEVLAEGARRARALAMPTIEEVKQRMGLA
jgi:tryptophanyl-tRNA synthetase